MSEQPKNPEFLKKKYALHESEEVESAARRTETRTGEEVEDTPEAQIQNYLDRFQEILEREDPSKRERGVEAIKRLLHRKLIIKPDVATDVYLKYQQRQAHERGHGDVYVPDRVKDKINSAVEATASGANLKQELQGFSDEEKQMAEEIVAKIDEQKHTLDYWIDYLTGPDALYPDWLKYWAIRSVTELSSYDKDEKTFPKRRPDTINSFPDLNQQALSNVLDAITKNEVYRSKLQELKDRLQPKESRSKKREKQRLIAKKIKERKKQDPDAQIDRRAIVKEVEEELGRESFAEQEEVQALRAEREHVDEGLQVFLDSAEFAKLYAQELEKLAPIDESTLANTNGQWVKYDQGSDHIVLAKSLQPYNTGWCTAGENTAESQLSRGDFYVYYSEDENGDLTIPRSAIRMEGDEVAEVRGIAPDQNMDAYITPIIRKAAKTKGVDIGGEFQEVKGLNKFLKKSEDMDRVSEIYYRTLKKDPETKRITVLSTKMSPDELRFIYEIDSKIEGFGYHNDPRVKELRDARNPEADMPIVFECKKEQIASTPDQINETAKAYVGPLEPEVFQKIAEFGIEHIYTAFPERRIHRQTIEIGGKTKDELLQELKKKGMKVYTYAKEMMNRPEFVVSKEKEDANLVRLTVADLDIKGDTTTEKIYARAIELGLELVPAEVGPQYRLQYEEQPAGEYLYMGMETIPDPGGDPDVFRLNRDGGDLWLACTWANPEHRWRSDDEFVFRTRKSES